PEIPHPRLGKQRDLSLAVLILRVACVIEQKAAADTERERATAELVPGNQPARRLRDLVVAGLERRIVHWRRRLTGLGLLRRVHRRGRRGRRLLRLGREWHTEQQRT